MNLYWSHRKIKTLPFLCNWCYDATLTSWRAAIVVLFSNQLPEARKPGEHDHVIFVFTACCASLHLLKVEVWLLPANRGDATRCKMTPEAPSYFYNVRERPKQAAMLECSQRAEGEVCFVQACRAVASIASLSSPFLREKVAIKPNVDRWKVNAAKTCIENFSNRVCHHQPSDSCLTDVSCHRYVRNCMIRNSLGF